MSNFRELARFTTIPPEKERVGLDQKVQQSLALLSQFTFETDDPSIISDFTIDGFRHGVVPRLSPFDLPHIPEGARLVRIPNELVDKLKEERSYDLARWNSPERFLFRLRLGQEKFESPVPGRSRVMDRLAAEGKVVSFDDLKVSPPEPNDGRKSRKRIDQGIESPIMGQARIPFALGSVPDVGSALAYATIAQANGMAFISRDKLLSDQRQQALLAKEVIDYLKTVELPSELYPNNEQLAEFAEIMGIAHEDPNAPFDYERLKFEYINTLRNSWVANIGAAIEADAEGDNGSKALKRAEELYETGCRMFRIYSPEGEWRL